MKDRYVHGQVVLLEIVEGYVSVGLPDWDKGEVGAGVMEVLKGDQI